MCTSDQNRNGVAWNLVRIKSRFIGTEYCETSLTMRTVTLIICEARKFVFRYNLALSYVLSADQLFCLLNI